MHKKIVVLLKYLKIQLDTNLKIILFNHQIGWSERQNFLLYYSTYLRFLCNYLNNPTKLFLGLYLYIIEFLEYIGDFDKIFVLCVYF